MTPLEVAARIVAQRDVTMRTLRRMLEDANDRGPVRYDTHPTVMVTPEDVDRARATLERIANVA